MNFRLHTLLATTALAAAAGHAGAAPRVAADILPVQSIAARVMAGEPLSNFPQRPPYKEGRDTKIADQMTMP